MARDRLFLIQPGFETPAREGRFVCPFCNQLEGLISSFPELAAGLDIERVPFPRPRKRVIEAIGEESQGLPVMILYDNQPGELPVHEGKAYANNFERILALLAERHGFPKYV